MQLRPYQTASIESIKADWQAGFTDLLAVLATGGGKTIVFLKLLDDVLQPGQRALILSHRQELVSQPYERIAQFWPHRLPRTGIVMADRNETHGQIIIATVQTLQSDKRMAQLLQAGAIDYLVIDEAHHATANGYQKVVNALKDVNPRLRHLGVTATPLRADGAGLRQVYQKESAHYGIKELVKTGYLAPPRWLAIQTGISLSDIRSQGSGDDRDFNLRQLANVYETANCFDLVVESHRKYADGRQAVAFTVSVAGAYQLAETFNAAGIPAAAADGTTGTEERSRLLADFRSGKYQVLCNVALWTEGLDLPEISCVHQVRPTQSDGLYTQMIGRGLRLLPGKNDCIAEGQRVLTDVGMIPIEHVTTEMKVWDGESFTSHCGAVCRGEKEVITYAGLTATPDHKVWTDDGWKPFGECAANGTSISVTGNGWRPIWEIDGYRRNAENHKESPVSANALHNMRQRGNVVALKSAPGYSRLPQMWAERSAWKGSAESTEVALSARSGCATTVHQSERSKLQSVWRKGYRVPIRFATRNGRMGGGESGIAQGNGDRSYRQRWTLRAGQSAMGNADSECCQQHESKGEHRVSCIQKESPGNNVCGCDTAPLVATGNDTGTNHRKIQSPVMQAKRRVWDILNAGPKHRFTVEGLLVSNCLILDYAPVDSRNIAMLGDVLGVEAQRAAYVKESDEPGEVIAGFTFDGETKWLAGNPMEIVSRTLDYLNLSPWRWSAPEGKAGPIVLGLGVGDDGTDRTIVISKPADKMQVWLVAKRDGERWHVAYPVASGTFEECSEWATDYADKRGNSILARKQASWRSSPPSDGQINYARRLGVLRDGMTKGDVAEAITCKLALDAVARKERTVGWL